MSDKDTVWKAVNKRYAEVAKRKGSRCCPPSCCNDTSTKSADVSYAEKIGYSQEEIAAAPTGSELGLGCGNPVVLASIQPGEVVLDLGSGGGFDCFLAAQRVGPSGRVIGIDMTEEMIEKARRNAEVSGYGNVEFRLGKIEDLPVEDESVDLIISNCVINLSPDKERVYREAFRVLKPGGRLAVSDVIAFAPITDEIRSDMALHSSCVAGAVTVDEIRTMMESAGLDSIKIDLKPESREFIKEWMPGSGAEDYVASANIEAVRPK